MSRLKDKYQQEVLPKLKEELGIKNSLAVPRVAKVVVNVGMGDSKDNQGMSEKVIGDLAALSGQKPMATKAKQSIAGFKLAKGQIVGAAVTLRGQRMYQFLDKLFNLVFPKVRDFRGISDSSFDKQGNYTTGLKEQAIFPEVGFSQGSTSGKIRGLEISIVTTAKNQEEGKRLLELLGMPFKK